MLIGYARTSTLDQEAGFEAQLRELKSAGCGELFKEQVSSVAKREQLETALKFIRKGDTLVVTKLDRLARSMADLMKITTLLEDKDAHLQVLGMGLNTADATGRLMLNVIGSVAQFEREMMLERQREGIAKAQREGKYKGRKATVVAQADLIVHLKGLGLNAEQIAEKAECSRSSVFRILKDVMEGRIKVKPVVHLEEV